MIIKYIDERVPKGERKHSVLQCDQYTAHFRPGGPDAKSKWRRVPTWCFSTMRRGNVISENHEYEAVAGTAIYIMENGRTVDTIYDFTGELPQEEKAPKRDKRAFTLTQLLRGERDEYANSLMETGDFSSCEACNRVRLTDGGQHCSGDGGVWLCSSCAEEAEESASTSLEQQAQAAGVGGPNKLPG